jgi:hypothetical protein
MVAVGRSDRCACDVMLGGCEGCEAPSIYYASCSSALRLSIPAVSAHPRRRHQPRTGQFHCAERAQYHLLIDSTVILGVHAGSRAKDWNGSGNYDAKGEGNDHLNSIS